MLIILIIEPILTALDLNILKKKIKKFVGNKNIITNIFRIQAYDSIMCGYLSIGFINFMVKDKSLSEYTNLFSPDDYEKNDKLIL